MIALPAPIQFLSQAELCCPGLFYLAAGRVQVVYAGRHRLSICELAPGAVFGDCSRKLILISLTRGYGYALNPSVLAEYGALRLAYWRTLMQIVAGLEAAQETDAYQHREQKLAGVLLSLVDTTGRITISHERLARLFTGTGRESVSETIGHLRQAGLLSTGYRRITLLDRRGLAVVAGGEHDAGVGLRLASGSATVRASDSATVRASDSATVVAAGSATGDQHASNCP